MTSEPGTTPQANTQANTNTQSEGSGAHALPGSLKDIGRRLEQMRDQLRVNVNLLGKDAARLWTETIEPELRDFDKSVRETGHQVQDELKARGVKLEAQLRELKDKVLGQTKEAASTETAANKTQDE